MKVLLVDDEASIRDFMKLLLEMKGHTVIEAASHEEAVDWLGEVNDFDLVITDNDMVRKSDGMKVVEAARSKSPALHVIWMSGALGYNPGLGDEAIRRGAYATLAKPFQMEEVDALIARLNTAMSLDTVPL